MDGRHCFHYRCTLRGQRKAGRPLLGVFSTGPTNICGLARNWPAEKQNGPPRKGHGPQAIFNTVGTCLSAGVTPKHTLKRITSKLKYIQGEAVPATPIADDRFSGQDLGIDGNALKGRHVLSLACGGSFGSRLRRSSRLSTRNGKTSSAGWQYFGLMAG